MTARVTHPAAIRAPAAMSHGASVRASHTASVTATAAPTTMNGAASTASTPPPDDDVLPHPQALVLSHITFFSLRRTRPGPARRTPSPAPWTLCAAGNPAAVTPSP